MRTSRALKTQTPPTNQAKGREILDSISTDDGVLQEVLGTNYGRVIKSLGLTPGDMIEAAAGPPAGKGNVEQLQVSEVVTVA